jgi:hypothetical protein
MTQQHTPTEEATVAIRKWQAVLDILRQENNLLKSRLTQYLQQDTSKSFLETAEYFHQRFLFKDQLMELLRHDITDLWQEIKTPVQALKHPHWQTRFQTLEKDMDKLQTEFTLMKEAFDTHLQAN